MLNEIILFAALIFAAGFFSAVEIAIASFGSKKIEELKDGGDKSAASFEKIQKEPNIFFGTIQFIIVLCLFPASLMALLIIKDLNGAAFIFAGIKGEIILLAAAVIVSAVFIICFGVLIPKAVGFKYAESIARSTVKMMILLCSIFKYPVIAVTRLSNFLLIPFKEKTDFSQTRFSEDEIRIILSEGVKTGAIDETEHEIIENIFEFNDLKANEVMIPRTDIVAIESTGNDGEMAGEIMKISHSLVPIYVETIDNIIGVLHIKDFMKSYIEHKNVSIKSLIRPAFFVPETKNISELLREMQTRGERLAFVMDEYGGTEGLITIEDILEEIVGDIKDNSKSEIKEFVKLPDGKYYVLGSMTIDGFNETFNIKLPYSDEYNTVAGFVADKTGKILNSGEIFEYENLVFELIKKLRQKMVQFKVYDREGNLQEKTQ